MLAASPLFIVKDLQCNMLKKYSGRIKGRVLDVGCGTKPYRSYLRAANEYVGMDINEGVRPDIVGDIVNMPFFDGYFDGVLCAEVLEHLKEPEIGIRQISRVLKRGGHLYLTVPQEWCLHYEPEDYFRFTKYGIRYLLEKNGFKIEAVERIGGVFSLTGQRLVDAIWSAIVNLLGRVMVLRWAERAATMFCFPMSLTFYLLGKVGDNIDKRDAIGWAVLAVKE